MFLKTTVMQREFVSCLFRACMFLRRFIVGPVNTKAFSFENAYMSSMSLRLGLPTTLIRGGFSSKTHHAL